MMLGQAAVGLFLDPGMGKTSTVLAAFDVLQEAGLANKMLIIAPLRVCYSVWPAETEKWANFSHLRVQILHGKDKEEALTAEADVYVINPEGLAWLLEDGSSRLTSLGVDVLCVDESTRFKNTGTKRFKLLRKWLPTFKRRWILTGTPTPNGIMDLFGQVYLLDRGGALGAYITKFRSRWFHQSGFGGYNWAINEGAYEEILSRVEPFVIRLSAADHLDLPELRIGGQWDIKVELPERAAVVYREVESQFISNLNDGLLVAANAAAAGTKCRQIANGAVYYSEVVDDEPDVTRKTWEELHTAKLDALDSLLEELGGQPLLIFYEYDHDRDRISDRWPEIPCITGTSAARGATLVEGFNRGDFRALLAHPASAGHGLNLQQSCHHVVWFGLTWNLEYYQQAIDRVYRQGQQHAVTVYRILAKGTLDERVAQVLERKEIDQAGIMSALT